MKRTSFLATSAAAGALAVVPRFTLAAGPAATVKIGFLESFSGVFSDLGACHKAGALLALEDANRKGRVKFEFAFGDDESKPAVATTEANRLITQEKVDALFGGTSSANGLAVSALSLQAGIFNLALAPQDTSITGARATRTTYRFGPNVRMLLSALTRRAFALGKKWYFIQSDYALGKDAYASLSDALKRAGGTEEGHDIVPLGATDFSSVLTKVRNSGADVVMLCNSGLDAANTAKQFVDFGLNKKMRLSGISLEDIYYKALPLDALVGTTFPVLWTPTVSPAAAKLAARMRQGIKGYVGGRHYLGYMAAASLFDRITAAGSTKADKLADAFHDHSFDCAKTNRATYRGCDHQCAQDIYAGATVSQKQFAKTQFMFDVAADVPAAESAGSCASPWAHDATVALASQKIADRENYSAKTF